VRLTSCPFRRVMRASRSCPRLKAAGAGCPQDATLNRCLPRRKSLQTRFFLTHLQHDLRLIWPALARARPRGTRRTGSAARSGKPVPNPVPKLRWRRLGRRRKRQPKLALRRHFVNGAAWESNPPTDGLRRFRRFLKTVLKRGICRAFCAVRQLMRQRGVHLPWRQQPPGRACVTRLTRLG